MGTNERPVTAHSGPYPTQDPNPSPEQRDAEAAQILRRWQRGEPVVEIAESMGMNPRTAYNRLNMLINSDSGPSRGLVRHVSYARLEADWLLIQRTIEANQNDPEAMTIADLAKLLGVRRQIVESMVALMGARQPQAESDDDADLGDKEQW